MPAVGSVGRCSVHCQAARPHRAPVLLCPACPVDAAAHRLLAPLPGVAASRLDYAQRWLSLGGGPASRCSVPWLIRCDAVVWVPVVPLVWKRDFQSISHRPGVWAKDWFAKCSIFQARGAAKLDCSRGGGAAIVFPGGEGLAVATCEAWRRQPRDRRREITNVRHNADPDYYACWFGARSMAKAPEGEDLCSPREKLSELNGLPSSPSFLKVRSDMSKS